MAITYTKESLQKLLDNVDIDALSTIYQILTKYQKQDYESLLKELWVEERLDYSLIKLNEIFYQNARDSKIIYIMKKQSADIFNFCIPCLKNDLNSIRCAVEFLQSLLNIEE